MTEDQDDTSGAPASPQGSLRPGVRLNGMFEIERLIAEGGMGEVYKGVAIASGDAVAIKLVRPDMARHPDVIALFRREAAILHNLLHDAIPRYYVFSVEPELQRAYIAMEFVDGVSLQKRLASGPLSTAEVRVLLKRIGGALELAHANGVVHRDVSSDNIILPNGDPRRAKIVDFGIARATQSSEGTIIGGGFAGKYKYVSPEQLGLAGGEVTPKSDMYSFGLVVAEALQGRAIDMGSNQAEVIERRKKTPDLSGVDVSLRPLLTAMLAPDPKDRPANMAEVAAWGETVERTRIAASEPAPIPVKAGRGRSAAIAAGVVLLGLGVAGYALKDKLLPPGETPVAGGPASTHGLPSLPPASPTPSPPSPSPTMTEALATPEPTTDASPAPPAVAPTIAHAETPTLEKLLEELAPKAAQAELALPPAVVGAPMRAELPAFSDPGGKTLALHLTPSAPPGLAFRDLGGGRGLIEGTPTQAGGYDFEVVAINPHGKSAHMKVALLATGAPPKPALSVVDLEPATLGSPYSAALPPFRSPERLKLRAEPLPAGLAFADLGGGLSQLAGQPAKAGRFHFDVVAAAASGGAEARTTVNLEVRPAPTPTTSVEAAAPPTPLATTAAFTAPPIETFLREFDGGSCFAVRSQDGGQGVEFAAIGADRAAFQRFEAAYRSAYRREPDVRASLVLQEQCPAADLLRQSAASAPPQLTLDTTDVGKGRPLAGAITALRGRALLLLAIVDDGRAVKLRTQVSPNGDAASFNLALTGDAQSLSKPELLLAIASDKPLSGFETFRSGPSADVLPRIGGQWREAGGSAAVAMFKLVN